MRLRRVYNEAAPSFDGASEAEAIVIASYMILLFLSK